MFDRSESTDCDIAFDRHLTRSLIRISHDYPIRLADQLKAHLRSLRKQRGLTQRQ
jgi:hypothetical protein